MNLKYLIPLTMLVVSLPSHAIFVDGKGHYALRGETQTSPGFSGDSGDYQVVNQYFQLDTELRVSDRSSFIAEISLFENERAAYLGDTAQPNYCTLTQQDEEGNDVEVTGQGTDCVGQQQSTLEPRYQGLKPRITKAYAKYAMDYCLLTAGRRGRQWGLGILFDEGDDVFDTDASVYDGITCDFNIQKSQTLGFSVGYDKISETGSNPYIGIASDEVYGATNSQDDLDQIFFTIEYNDHKLNAGKGFSQQIGIYFANILGGSNTKTDIKLADIYLNFLISDLVIQNEFIFRLGDSADPNLKFLGAGRNNSEVSAEKKNVTAVAVAGNLEYFLSRSGSLIGPDKYKQGNLKSHSIFLDYAYAPGDSDGFLANEEDRTGNTAGAVAFHRNYKPGLILFNGPTTIDSTYRVDGIFDPSRVMNATIFSLGYRYKSLENGNFEVKAISATMNTTATDEIKAQIDAELEDADIVRANRGFGYEGGSIGYELDLSYSKTLGRGLELGVAAAYAQPGDAWKIEEDQDLKASYLLRSHISFSF